MTFVRLKGLKRYRDRHGRWRYYHRKTGIAIKAEYRSAAFVAELAALEATVAPKAEAKPGTLGLLIALYRKHEAFKDLAPRTRSDYQKHFDYLKPIADTPLARFDKPLVVRIRDKAATSKGRKFANDVKARLSGVFSWGAERGHIASNVALGIKDIRRKRGIPDANRPWTDAERHAVLEAIPPHMLPVLGLMMYTGLGPKDAVKLPRTFYRNGEIATRRSKTGQPVFWPCPAPLAAILAAAESHNAMTLCANSRGLPWTRSGYSASWRPVRQRLESDGKVESGLTPYGLRHTVAVVLREIGCDDRTIADALGQKTEAMARHYSKGADLTAKMRPVAAAMDAEWDKRRTKTV
jgi:integrase